MTKITSFIYRFIIGKLKPQVNGETGQHDKLF